MHRLGVARIASRIGLRFAVAASMGIAAMSACAGTAAVLPQADAVAWLQRIREAGRCTDYRGTLVFSEGAAVSSSRVVHFCHGEHQFEATEALDGQASRTWRFDDLVHTVWPAERLVVVERRAPLAAFPALVQSGEFEVEDQYDFREVAADRVAGVDAVVLSLWPRDAWRFAQRLWVARRSGLLLRADMVGADGSLLERVTFSELQIGGPAKPETILQPMKALGGMRVVRPMLRSTALEAEGWSLTPPVPGFRLMSSVRRSIEAGPSDAGTAAEAEVLQAIYSDGLTHLSLFIEPFDADRNKAPVTTRIGATNTVASRVGDQWVTAMGDVPSATLDRFVAALHRLR